MILEAYLSTKTCGLSDRELFQIKKVFIDLYGPVEFNENDKSSIIELLKYDKKNSHGLVKYALLEKIGVSKVDVVVTDTMIHEAFSYYAS